MNYVLNPSRQEADSPVLDLPGVTEKDVRLSITGDLLTVKGERRFERVKPREIKIDLL